MEGPATGAKSEPEKSLVPLIICPPNMRPCGFSLIWPGVTGDADLEEAEGSAPEPGRDPAGLLLWE